MFLLRMMSGGGGSLGLSNILSGCRACLMGGASPVGTHCCGRKIREDRLLLYSCGI